MVMNFTKVLLENRGKIDTEGKEIYVVFKIFTTT